MKKYMLIIMSVLFVFILTACSTKLPDGMTKEKTLAAAEEIITLLNEKSYDAILEKCDKTLLVAFSVTPIADTLNPILNELGSFEKIENTAVQGKDNMSVASLLVKYENKSATYTLSFNTEYKLSGIWVK